MRAEGGTVEAGKAVFVAIIVLVVGAMGLISSTAQTRGGAASNGSGNGLQLRLTDNATTLVVGQRLEINVSIFNSLPSVNRVVTSDNWPFRGVPVALWPPCYYTMPVVAVVLLGNYDLQSLPTVANVTFPIRCMEGVTVDHAILQPNSSQANLTGIYNISNTNQTLGPFRLSASFTTTGYWDLLGNSRQLNPGILNEDPPRPPTVTAFIPGVYTVAVADEWGQAVILHVFVRAW
jgi:hypothetical protein